MLRPFVRHRQGTTLVELLVFVAFFAVCSGVVLSLFFATSEQRVRQQTIATVEREGMQLAQTIVGRIRASERVLDPARGTSGAMLALQISDEMINPTIIMLYTGSLVVAQYNKINMLSSERLDISDFVVQNTSVTDDINSVLLRFTASKDFPLTQTGSFSRDFEMAVSLYPDDVLETHCGCTAPACNGGSYEWQICNVDTCESPGVTLPCE